VWIGLKDTQKIQFMILPKLDFTMKQGEGRNGSDYIIMNINVFKVFSNMLPSLALMYKQRYQPKVHSVWTIYEKRIIGYMLKAIHGLIFTIIY
jgi:hypothetical protein